MPCTNLVSMKSYRWLSGKKKKKKNLPTQCKRHKRHRFNPWFRKIPWRRKWQPTPVFLPGKFHGQRSLAGYSPRGRRVGHHWASERACSKSKGNTGERILSPAPPSGNSGSAPNLLLEHPGSRVMPSALTHMPRLLPEVLSVPPPSLHPRPSENDFLQMNSVRSIAEREKVMQRGANLTVRQTFKNGFSGFRQLHYGPVAHLRNYPRVPSALLAPHLQRVYQIHPRAGRFA